MRSRQLLLLSVLAVTTVACALSLDEGEFTKGGDDAGALGDSVAPPPPPGAPPPPVPPGTTDASDGGSDVVTAPPCLVVGDRCPDGTVIIDTTGGVKSYAAPCDVGMTWTGTTCTGTRSELTFNDGTSTGGVFVGATDPDDGQTNTAKLLAADSDSAVAGKQPHAAAAACATLGFAGHDDWFLPATSELATLYDMRNVIGNFEQSARFYKSSTETHDATQPLNAERQRFNDGYQYLDGDSKPAAELVRCIRGN